MVLTYFFFSFFTIAMGLTAKTAKDAYFLSRFEKSILPLMFLAVAIAIAPILGGYTKLAKKLAPKVMFIITTSIFGASFILSQHMIEGWVIPVIYIWVEIVVAIALIQYWGFAAESFQPQQAKRLFGIIAGGGSFAVMLIGMNLRPFVNAFGTDELLYLATGFMGLSFIFGLLSMDYMKKEVSQKAPVKINQAKTKKPKDPFLLGIMGIVALSGIVTVLVDYQFKMIASDTFPDESKLVAFFGLFYSISGACSIVMQFFVTGPVLSRFGILIGLMVLPFFLILGSVAFIVVPVLISATIGKFSDQTFKFTIFGSSMELLWLPVPADTRRTLKPQVSGTIKSIAEGFGGVTTFLLAKFVALQTLSFVSLGAIFLWILTSFRVKNGYVKQLENAISKRQIDFEELNVDVQDAAMVKTIEDTLSSNNEMKQLFAFEIVEGLPLHSWKDTISDLFNNGSSDVRKRILDLAWDEEEIISNDNLIGAIHKNDEVSAKAIVVSGKRKLSEIQNQLEDLLESESKEQQSAAAAAIIDIDAGSIEKAVRILNNALESDDEQTKANALKRLEHNENILPESKLIEFLEDESTYACNVALQIAEKRKGENLIPAIISNLSNIKTSIQARQTLKVFSDDLVANNFSELLSKEELSRSLKLGIIKTLRDYPSVDLLMNQLHHADQDIYNEVVDSLLVCARVESLNEKQLNIISSEIQRIAKKLYAMNESKKLLPDDDKQMLMIDHFNNEIQNTLPSLLKLGVMSKPNTPIETYIQIIKSGDPAKLPFLLEFFENIFDNDQRNIINPLIEEIPIKERSEIGNNHFKDLPSKIDDELLSFLHSPNKWESIISLDYLINAEKKDLIAALDWDKVPNSAGNCELVQRLSEKNNLNIEDIPLERFKLEHYELGMYSTLEKTIILKSVDLFKSIPAENLSRVAQITEEVRCDEGDSIIAEGEYGDSLFIVVNGNVKIHKGEKEITRMGEGSCIGDMALLDGEPRSADVTAVEETTLFKIEQEGFYEVMGSHGDIMEAIIKNLSGRVRNMNEQLYSK